MIRISSKTLEGIFLTVLFCFSISLFNLAGYIFAAIILFFWGRYGWAIRFSSVEWLIILFSLSYFLFYALHFGVGINEITLYLFGPCSAYVLGKFYVEKSTYDNPLVMLIVILASGMYLHGVLNIIAYIRSDYFWLYNYYRQSVDFWRNELVNVKTTEMLYTFATGASLGVLFTTYRKKYKAIAVMIIGISLLLTVFMANRTLLVIFLAIFLWRLFAWFHDTKITTFRKTIMTFLIILIPLAVFIAIDLNIAGVGDFFQSLKIVQRLTSGNELTRFDVWSLFFEDLKFLEHPFGGKLLTEGTLFGYFHNAWFDVYNVVGIIPFVLLFILTLKWIKDFLLFSKRMKVASQKNELLVVQSLLMAVVMNMMVEPIIEANPYYFLMLLMLLGAMEAYARKSIKELDC